MAVVKNLLVRAGADFSSMRNGMKQAQSNVKNFRVGVSQELKKMSSGVSSAVKRIGALIAAAFAVKKIYDFGKASVASYREITIATAKLEQVMKNTMGATRQQIKSIHDLAAAQQKIGVIDVGTQLSGAQELGTYLSQAESLQILLPTLNDMLAQQYGLDATAENAVQIGTMIGKVMDGQLGALSRYGYSWTEAQEKVLKFGNELERAAMLSEVIGQSVGGMNQALAQTPFGRMKQLSFTFAEIKEEIGKGLMPVISAAIPYLQAMADAVMRVAKYFTALMNAIFGVKAAQDQVTIGAKSAANAQSGVGKEVEKAGKKAKNAVAGFDEINQLVEAAGDAAEDGIGDMDFESGSSDGFAIPEIDTDTDTVPAEIQSMVDRIKGMFDGLWSDMSEYGGRISEAFSGVRPALQPFVDMQEPIKASLSEIGQTFNELIDSVLRPAADYMLLDFIPSIVTGFTESFAPVFADYLTWAFQEFSNTFKNITNSAAALLNDVWIPAAEKIKLAFLDAFPKVANALQTLLDGTFKPFASYIMNGFLIPISDAMARTFIPIFADTGVWAIQEFVRTFEWAANLINSIYQKVIQPVFELIQKIVLDTLQIITDLWAEYGQELLDNISELFEGIRNTFQLLWDEILKPIIEPFLEMLNWLWDKHLKDLIKQVGEFIMKLVNGALEIFNKFILPIVNWLIETLGPTFVRVFNFVVDVIGSAVAMISDVIKGLMKILGGLIDFIVGVFAGDWKKAWEGIRDIFKGIVDTLWGIVKFPLNLIIDGINVIIDGLNSLSFDIPDWVPFVGGESFGISIPRIPKLARGGIVDSATNMGNYIAGEAGRELIVPLENTSFVDKIASALGTAVMSVMQMSQSGRTGGGEVIVQLDGTTVGRVMLPYLEQEQSRIGTAILQTNP